MSNTEDKKKLLSIYNRRLQKLKEQNATQGVQTPPHILIEIEDIKVEIKKLQTELRGMEKDEQEPRHKTENERKFTKNTPSTTVRNSDSQTYISQGGGATDFFPLHLLAGTLVGGKEVDLSYGALKSWFLFQVAHSDANPEQIDGAREIYKFMMKDNLAHSLSHRWAIFQIINGSFSSKTAISIFVETYLEKYF